ncbi:glycoside hydrolase family 28 protein [Prevotella sp. P6B4]|uniref:glycoside hydrolase family 28 protein n=1 Tax=Prevotella sp. P6B4 TaxID=1410614 RepID=UPI0009DD322E|nr:glycosyl hydrolase family 28 protein [Prevotella sp. P6B4]
MKIKLSTTITTVALLLMNSITLSAQVIDFSMAEEIAGKNTPEGWTEVNLPQSLPTFTDANTFYITDFGATTTNADNTQAIQAALDAANNAGGGMVVVPAGEWLFGRITIGSKTVLHLCAHATLKLLAYSDQPDHTTKDPYIKGKNGASDIVIEGESSETSIIEGQGAPWWDAVEQKVSGLQRGSIIRFSQGQRYLFRHFRIQNAPGTNLTLGQSGKGAHNTVHDVHIYAPASSASDPSHNTDGIPIWTQYCNIYNCYIDTGDDNVVTDTDAQYIHLWNCNFKAGHGASLGSYTQNMHHIIYEDLTFDGTDCGFRLKSNTDRSGDVHDIIFRNCTMQNVATPIQITAWYDKLPDSPEEAEASPETKTSSTPEFHNILIQNVTASGYNTKNSNDKNYNGIMIYGRPESYVYDVTFDNVRISHRNGVRLFFCKDIRFINGCTFTKTRTNKTVEATGNDLSPVMENSYKATYSWNNLSSISTQTISDSSQTKNTHFYTLNGCQVIAPSKGIFIHQGKKIVIK